MVSISPFLHALYNWTDVFMRRSMHNFILYSKTSGLSMPQIGALFHIYRGSGGVSDLGSDLGITSAAASQMLDRLVQLGFVVRSENPQDRRLKHIVLTEHGRQTLQESVRARQSWLDDLDKCLSDAEKEQITTALKILVERSTQLENNMS